MKDLAVNKGLNTLQPLRFKGNEWCEGASLECGMKNEDLKHCEQTVNRARQLFYPISSQCTERCHSAITVTKYIYTYYFAAWGSGKKMKALCWFKSLLIIHLEALVQALNAGLMMIQFVLTAPLIADLVSFPNTVGEWQDETFFFLIRASVQCVPSLQISLGSLIWSRSYTVYFLASVSGACVFQMCELEVATSLVKAMTNGAVRWSAGRVGDTHCIVAWGANMPSMPTDSTDPGLWCPSSPVQREAHGLGPTCGFARVCMRVHVWICWTSWEFDMQVWKLGVRFMCDKLPTCGIIGATLLLLLSSAEETHSSNNF